jgi:hypothetical protein
VWELDQLNEFWSDLPHRDLSLRSTVVACYAAGLLVHHRRNERRATSQRKWIPYPALKTQIPLFVTISRQKIEVAEGAASATSDVAVKVEAKRKIVIEVIARKNC